MCARLSQGPLSPGSICSLNQDMEAQPYPLSPFSAGGIIQHREASPGACETVDYLFGSTAIDFGC